MCVKVPLKSRHTLKTAVYFTENAIEVLGTSFQDIVMATTYKYNIFKNHFDIMHVRYFKRQTIGVKNVFLNRYGSLTQRLKISNV